MKYSLLACYSNPKNIHLKRGILPNAFKVLQNNPKVRLQQISSSLLITSNMKELLLGFATQLLIGFLKEALISS